MRLWGVRGPDSALRFLLRPRKHDEPPVTPDNARPRFPRLRRLLNESFGPALLLSGGAATLLGALFAWALGNALRGGVNGGIPMMLVATGAPAVVFAAVFVRRFRGVLGPGIDLRWEPSVLRKGEPFTVMYWPFGRSPTFDEATVSLVCIDTIEKDGRVRPSCCPAFFNPDEVPSAKDILVHTKMLVTRRDFARHPFGGSVAARIPDLPLEPGIRHLPIDGWRLRVECRRAGTVVFREDHPIRLALADSATLSPGEETHAENAEGESHAEPAEGAEEPAP